MPEFACLGWFLLQRFLGGLPFFFSAVLFVVLFDLADHVLLLSTKHAVVLPVDLTI